MSFFSELGKRFSDLNLKDVGEVLGGAANIYGTVAQIRNNNKMMNLKKNFYNHQMKNYQREVKRQEEANKAVQDGFAYGMRKKKKKEEETQGEI